MPEIQAFRGLRYDLGHVGSLSDVVAPPYDVIDTSLQEELYKRHAANVVRLILNREEPGDDDQNSRYTRASSFLKNWRQEGVLFTESDPAIYVYHQRFQEGGQEYTRRGFMCRVRLSRFGEGNIYPHERTHSGPKADRLRLMQTCHSNLSQIFGLYPDTENDAQDLLADAIEGKTPLEATDHLGVVHQLWPVTDVSVIARLSSVMGPKPIFVADGHHRFETACDYRDHRERQLGELPSHHSANFVLMMCVGMHDPGMIVLPTHRLFRGIPPFSSAQLVERLGDCFTTRVAGEGSDLANSVWDEMNDRADQNTLGLYCRPDDRWVLATLTDSGRAKLATIAPEQSDELRGLGVTILHRLVIETLLEVVREEHPEYVHLVDELIDRLDLADDQDDDFQLAALVMPATVDDIYKISQLGERMPPKSTYFYPKLLSGLVINPID